jgi:hypothetical protein
MQTVRRAVLENRLLEIWEIKRQYVRPDPNGPTATVHLEDAGALCSRNCMRDYLGPGDRSGVFNIRECDT